MLTRIEITGFRTFEDFGLDLEPFLVVLGANNTGKSNLLEAIQLLSGLASAEVATAFRGLRGEVSEVFRWGGDGQPGQRMTLAAEVLLSPTLQGGTRQLPVPHTRLRYEVEIERGPGEEDVRLLREEARPIAPRNDAWANRPTVSAAFRSAYLRYERTAPWLPAAPLPGVGANTGNGAAGARPGAATVLAGLTDAADVCLLALRAELRSWRLFHLELSALRKPTPAGAPQELAADGSNLAGHLARLQAETGDDARPEGALADVIMLTRAILTAAPPVGVVQGPDGGWRLVFRPDGRPRLGAQSASDGTMRVVALLALLCDPERRGLLCLEEADNGIHPSRLPRLLEVVRGLSCASTSSEIDPERPLSQLILTGFSPMFVEWLRDPEIGFTDVTWRRSLGRTRIRTVRPAEPGVRLAELTPPAMTRAELRLSLVDADAER